MRNKVGITLIFYIQNFRESRERMLDKEHHPRSVPVAFRDVHRWKGSSDQEEPETDPKVKVAAKKTATVRFEAAKNGDEDAMESLTIEDIDLYPRFPEEP